MCRIGKKGDEDMEVGQVKQKGRRPTTGRYESREELERMVRHWYSDPGKSMDVVARICGVSTSMVQKILSQKEATKQRGVDVVVGEGQ